MIFDISLQEAARMHKTPIISLEPPETLSKINDSIISLLSSPLSYRQEINLLKGN